MRYRNIGAYVEIIVVGDEEITDDYIRKEVINAAKTGRWVHVSNPRVVHEVHEPAEKELTR